jgi:hypothetical protein
MSAAPQARRFQFSLLLLMGLVIPVSFGVALGRQWAQLESVEPPPLPERPRLPKWELVATFSIAGEEYQLFEMADEGIIVPNQVDLTLALVDARGTILYQQDVPGHRYGFPEPIVEVGEDPILSLDYIDGGFVDCARTDEVGRTRLHYRITATGLERLADERIEPLKAGN